MSCVEWNKKEIIFSEYDYNVTGESLKKQEKFFFVVFIENVLLLCRGSIKLSAN
mgnify:CR=1 FL=1